MKQKIHQSLYPFISLEISIDDTESCVIPNYITLPWNKAV